MTAAHAAPRRPARARYSRDGGRLSDQPLADRPLAAPGGARSGALPRPAARVRPRLRVAAAPVPHDVRGDHRQPGEDDGEGMRGRLPGRAVPDGVHSRRLERRRVARAQRPARPPVAPLCRARGRRGRARPDGWPDSLRPARRVDRARHRAHAYRRLSHARGARGGEGPPDRGAPPGRPRRAERRRSPRGGDGAPGGRGHGPVRHARGRRRPRGGHRRALAGALLASREL